MRVPEYDYGLTETTGLDLAVSRTTVARSGVAVVARLIADDQPVAAYGRVRNSRSQTAPAGFDAQAVGGTAVVALGISYAS
jgi:hypothetical protein